MKIIVQPEFRQTGLAAALPAVIERLLGNRTGTASSEFQIQVLRQLPHRGLYRLQLCGETFFLKHYVRRSFYDRMRQFITGTAAEHEYANLLQLYKHGIPVVSPVACVVVSRGNLPADSFLLTRAVDPSISLQEFICQVKSADKKCQKRLLRSVATSLAQLLALLYANGINHRDLHLGNLLVTAQIPNELNRGSQRYESCPFPLGVPPSALQVLLVDVAKVRFCTRPRMQQLRRMLVPLLAAGFPLLGLYWPVYCWCKLRRLVRSQTTPRNATKYGRLSSDIFRQATYYARRLASRYDRRCVSRPEETVVYRLPDGFVIAAKDLASCATSWPKLEQIVTNMLQATENTSQSTGAETSCTTNLSLPAEKLGRLPPGWSKLHMVESTFVCRAKQLGTYPSLKTAFGAAATLWRQYHALWRRQIPAVRLLLVAAKKYPKNRQLTLFSLEAQPRSAVSLHELFEQMETSHFALTGEKPALESLAELLVKFAFWGIDRQLPLSKLLAVDLGDQTQPQVFVNDPSAVKVVGAPADRHLCKLLAELAYEARQFGLTNPMLWATVVKTVLRRYKLQSTDWKSWWRKANRYTGSVLARAVPDRQQQKADASR